MMAQENELDMQMAMAPSEGEIADLETKVMDEAQKLQQSEDDFLAIEGDFSKRMLNRVVEALNRVNQIFQAPEYPTFDADLEKLPPEFGRNLEMVNSALRDAGMEEKTFDLASVENDKDLRDIAAKLDSAASDKVFKSFLAKPMGMGEYQAESGIPAAQTTGADVGTMSKPAVQPDEEELFMARMSS
jgi:hypothetical protein